MGDKFTMLISEQDYQAVIGSFIPEVTDYLEMCQSNISGHWYMNLIDSIEEFNITSPPEQLFFAVWSLRCRDEVNILQPQKTVESYFIDFALEPIQYFVNHPFLTLSIATLKNLDKILPKFAIEIDGKYHEESYNQIERDKQRERVITSHGYHVVRFTAREVFREPEDVVTEAWSLYKESLREPQKKMRQVVQEINFTF